MRYLLCVFFVGNLLHAQTQIGADIDGEVTDDLSGSSVSMPDNNTVAIGAALNDGNGSNSGHVRIYDWSGTSWVQRGADIDGEAAGDLLGGSISMPDSNTLAIGARGNDGNGSAAGHVRIYDWNGAAWIQRGADIDGEAAGDESGGSISMPNTNTVAIGASSNAGSISGGFGSAPKGGHVRIYDWNGTAWVQRGADIDGEGRSDRSGYSVSMPSINTVAIGAPFNEDLFGYLTGHVRIYDWNGTAWVQRGTDIEGDSLSFDLLGWSVSMPDSNTLACGSIVNNYTRIYDWSGTEWLQRGTDIDGEATGDQSGGSVSMPDANTVAIGAIDNDGNGSNSGHVRIYDWNGTVWIQRGTDIDGEAAGDLLGRSVCMPDTNTVAIGADQNDGNGFNSGHVRVYSIPPVSASITAQTNVLCGGEATGALTVTAADGTTPYTYDWSNGASSTSISNLLAGTYTVTVTDGGGGTATASATITEIAAIVVTLGTPVDVDCFGASTGSLMASVTGGTTPYTYNWNSGETSSMITNKPAGTYTVYVQDANGCGDAPPP